MGKKYTQLGIEERERIIIMNRDLIKKHKCLKIFEPEDYDLLAKYLSGFDQILVTPHIVTETSNLSSRIHDPAISAIRKTLADLLGKAKEEFQPSIEIVAHKSFFRLGLTDSAILDLIKKDTALITADLDLYLEALKVNTNAVNFTHLRQPRLLR